MGGQAGSLVNILSAMFGLRFIFCLCFCILVPLALAAQATGHNDAAPVDAMANDVGPRGPSDGLRSTDPVEGLRPPDPFFGLRPPARKSDVPSTRWTHQPDHVLWNRATLSALKAHGAPLVDLVPADVTDWCPRYPTATDADRRAFWLGFLSALAKHESTYKPRAVGGGGKWYGLLQILPATARGYGCNVGTGDALKNGAANLSCAVRIMAVTVPRDGVIYGRGGKGVAADWGPLRSRSKRADMAGWLQRQRYCAPLDSVRPESRPAALSAVD